MPTKIRIDDLEILRSAAAEKDQIIAELEEMVAALQAISAGAPSYDGQFAPRIKDLGAMEMAQIQGIIQRERESASYLRMKADAFEQAEQANLEGLAGLHAALWESVDRFGDASLMPLYLLRGSKPPHVSDLEWWHLPPSEREARLESLRMEWARFLAGRSVSQVHEVRPTRELLEWEFQIYLFGLPSAYLSINPKKSELHLTLLPKYLDPIDPNGPAQYFVPPGYKVPHYNLCGLLALGHSMGGTVDDVLRTFGNLKTYVSWEEADPSDPSKMITQSSSSGAELLKRNLGASQQNLVDLYRAYGWEAEIIGMFESDPQHWTPEAGTATAELLAERLRQGQAIIALVNLQTSPGVATYGYLDGADATPTNHFVEILEVLPTRDGGPVIRVFNPFLKREELYTWEHFANAWDSWDTTGRFRGVVASPSPAAPTP